MKNIKNVIFRKREEDEGIRIKALRICIGFFLFMLVFTILSRSVFGMTIPTVTVKSPESASVSYEIKETGVSVAVKHKTFSIEGGLLVSDVFVKKGSEVKMGDPLYALDLFTLEKQLEKAGLELEKLNMEIKDKIQNLDLDEEKKEEGLKRANQDYSQAAEENNILIEKAKKEMDAAKKAWEDFANQSQDGSADASMRATLSNQINNAEKELGEANKALLLLQETCKKETDKKIAEREKELTESDETLSEKEKEEIKSELEGKFRAEINGAKERISQANKNLADAKTALDAHIEKEKGENNGDRQTQEANLKGTYEQNRSAYEDAVRDKKKALDTAQRGIEDAKEKSMADSSLASLQLDRESKEKDISYLESLIAARGIVSSETDGIVTAVAVTAGSITTEGMAVMTADYSEGGLVAFSLSKDQIKHLKEGDSVDLKYADTGDSLGSFPVRKIYYLTDENNRYEVEIWLPPEKTSEGREIQMEVESRSERYPMTLPISALYDGESGQKYVLYIQEMSGFLGAQYKVEKADVTMLENNGKVAAITSYDLDNRSQIVVAADKALTPGDAVKVDLS